MNQDLILTNSILWIWVLQLIIIDSLVYISLLSLHNIQKHVF